MIWDLSHTLADYQPHFSTHTQYFRMMWNRLEDGDRSAHAQLIMGEHSGTHVDAPCHFFSGADSIDAIPLDRFMGPGRCIDVTSVGPGRSVSREDIDQFELGDEPIQSGDIVLFHFGFDVRWGIGASGKAYGQAWPGLSGEAADLLVERGVKAVGTDAISIDASGDPSSPAHHRLLGAGIVIYENLTGLQPLVGRRVRFFGLPLRIGQGTGSPVRAWAEGEERARESL